MFGFFSKFSIKNKIVSLLFALVISVGSLAMYIWFNDVGQFNEIEESVSKHYYIQDFSNALINEQKTIIGLISSPIHFTLSDYISAKEITDNSLKTFIELSQDGNSDINALNKDILKTFDIYRTKQEQLIQIYNHKRALSLSDKSLYYEVARHSDSLNNLTTEVFNENVSENLLLINNLKERNQSYYYMIFFMTILASICVIIIARLINKFIVNPIKELSKASEQISYANFETPDIVPICQDEIGILTETFNIMKNEMDIYFKTLEEKSQIELELKQKELENVKISESLERAKFQGLQMQMDPHFLFNTLSSLAGLAHKEQASKTEDIIIDLAKYYRYTLANKSKLVEIETELEIINKFLNIQNMRFKDKFTYEVVCQDELLSFKIPQYILEPLVENSVIHGVMKKGYGGKIRVKISLFDDDMLDITVIDNGVGFNAKNAFNENGSVALNNIKKRLEIYDKQSFIKVFSHKNLGTVVKLRVRGYIDD